MLFDWFVLLIYQPFFNVLVFFYWMVGIVTGGNPDMGLAVIGLTLVVRLVLLPISLLEENSAEERRKIYLTAKELEEAHISDPIAKRKAIKNLFHSNPRVVAAEILGLAVQVSISLMLWRIFSRGLKGEDIHLLYVFMPKITLPFNLTFLGFFDLTHTSFMLNALQSFLIFVLETISIYSSPYPPEKGEVVRLQLVLPVMSFIIFMGLPAGKKLFVITALIVSILIAVYKGIKRRYEAYLLKQELAAQAAEAPAEGEEKVLVETKE